MLMHCSLNVFNSACLMWHCECRTLTSIYVTLPTYYLKKCIKLVHEEQCHSTCVFFIYFFAIEILLLSSICSHIFCRLFDFAFFFLSLAILLVVHSSCFCLWLPKEVTAKSDWVIKTTKKPAKLTNKQIGYKSYRASQMTIEQCVQRITANRTNYTYENERTKKHF